MIPELETRVVAVHSVNLEDLVSEDIAEYLNEIGEKA